MQRGKNTIVLHTRGVSRIFHFFFNLNALRLRKKKNSGYAIPLLGAYPVPPPLNTPLLYTVKVRHKALSSVRVQAR